MNPRVIQPTSESEICDAVRAAAATGAAFEIIGHGTKRGLGRAANAHSILDVSALTGIVKYEPEELVITVRAATPISEIEAVLAERNQMLGFEPADWGPFFGGDAGHTTIAGAASANACGSRRVKAGAVRDHVIGCRFVNGEGEAIKAGGPVIKNVTGFDVTRLMCGAFGTLGVLTELTLRVVPKPARKASLMISCNPQEGLQALRDAARLPLDPTGLAYIPIANGTYEGIALIRVEGTSGPVESKLNELRKAFAKADTSIVEDEATNTIFRDVSDGKPFVEIDADIWRLCVPPASATEALKGSGVLGEAFWFADWAGGLLWLALPASDATATHLRSLTAHFGGHATLMRASAEARAELSVFEPESPARAGLTRSVKAAFDPHCVFNPGRMYKDI